MAKLHQEDAFEDMSDMLHHHPLSSDSAKMELMLLKIAMDAVEAYNHICDDHQIEIVSAAEVHHDLDGAVLSHGHHTNAANDIEPSTNEDAIATLSAALSDEESPISLSDDESVQSASSSEEDDDNITAEMISDMIADGEEAEASASAPEQTIAADASADLNAFVAESGSALETAADAPAAEAAESEQPAPAIETEMNASADIAKEVAISNIEPESAEIVEATVDTTESAEPAMEQAASQPEVADVMEVAEAPVAEQPEMQAADVLKEAEPMEQQVAEEQPTQGGDHEKA